MASGFPSGTNVEGMTSFTIDVQAAGDLLVVWLNGTGVNATALSGGGVTWSAPVTFTSAGYNVFYGTAVNTGSQTITITWASSISGIYVTQIQAELSIGEAATWALVTSAQVDGTGSPSTLLKWPQLESNTDALQAYLGFCDPDNAAAPFSAPSSDFSLYSVVGSGSSPVLFDGALSASTEYQPSCTAGTGGFAFEFGTIFSAVA